jgi:hypothetical protein
MPIERPRYDNAHVADFAQWFEDNQGALGRWYELTAPYAFPEDGDDFFGFCATQHDLQRFAS